MLGLPKETGQEVKKGEIVATLHKDDGSEEGKLVHLHFELHHGWDIIDRDCNSEAIYSAIVRYRAEPQKSLNFRITGVEEQPQLEIAHFKKLRIPL